MILFISFFSFVIGLASSFFSPFFFLLLLPLFLYLYFYRKEKNHCLFLLFSLLGFLLPFLFPSGKGVSGTITGIIIKSKENYFLLFSSKGTFYVYQKNHNLPFLSLVKMEGKSSSLSFSHYESGFDFSSYLKSFGVNYQFTGKVEVIFKSFFGKEKLKKYVFSYLDDKTRTLISSLLFSDSLYDLEEQSELSSLNLINIFSLSSFHLQFFLHFLRENMEKKYKKFTPYFEGGFLLFFLYLSDFKFSIRRLFLLYLLRLFFQEKHWSRTELLSLSGLIQLMIEPYQFLSESFYYSYPLLLFLSLFQKQGKKRKQLISFLKIQLFYLPFRIRENHAISLLSIPISFLLIPFSHLLFVLSLLLFPLPFFGILFNPICQLFLKSVSFFSSISFLIPMGDPGILFYILYFLLIFLSESFFAYAFQREGKACLLFALTITLCTASYAFLPHEEVTFIDVDQGDSTLLRSGNTNILIDTGGRNDVDLAKECLIPYFHKRKIYTLDALILTHSDFDHTGAKDSLLSSFSVKNVLEASNFLKEENQTIQIGDISIRNYNIYEEEGQKADDNYASGVYYTAIKGKRILVTGDAPKEIEEKIIRDHPELRADIVKISHHGSNTSSSPNFLSQIQPELAVISCGTNNRYHHPNIETLRTLDMLHIPYRRTDLEGTIQLSL